MGRSRLKPGYDPEKIQEELIEICRVLCVDSSNDNKNDGKGKNTVSMRSAANELGISVSKVVKLLITGDIIHPIYKLK